MEGARALELNHKKNSLTAIRIIVVRVILATWGAAIGLVGFSLVVVVHLRLGRVAEWALGGITLLLGDARH